MGQFAGKTIAELRDVARAAIAEGNDQRLAELLEEMRSRIQRKLDSGKKPTSKQREFLEELEAGAVAEADREPIAKKDSETASEELRRLRQEVELWRALYKTESEILAKWGMTPSLPPPIREKVFELWQEQLESFGDLVRTESRLLADQEVLTASHTAGSADDDR